jgi:hypothetical protein
MKGFEVGSLAGVVGRRCRYTRASFGCWLEGGCWGVNLRISLASLFLSIVSFHIRLEK